MGIDKRSLLEDYYFDEIGEIITEWNAIHYPAGEEEEEVDAMAFLGGGGERV